MSFVLGLTGSIGMGKSTTADMFAQAGVPVWDADATVRDLYSAGGAAAVLIAQYYPEVIVDGAVSRQKLRDVIAKNPKILDHIQALVHPLVAQSRAVFIEQATDPIVLLDIPLLFENGTEDDCDAIVVVSVSPDVQKQRVLARGGMTEADFELILSRQMPDSEKRAKARWVIETLTLEDARQSVGNILTEIKREQSNA